MTNSRSKPRNPQKHPTIAAGGELPAVTVAGIGYERLQRMPDKAKIALMEEIIESDFDGNAAAFSRHYDVNKGLVSRALNKGYIAPSISKALGWPVKVEVPACPHCENKAHTYDCQKQIVKAKPKKQTKRPKRKPRPYFKCRQDDIEQVMKQVAKYHPDYEIVKKEGE